MLHKAATVHANLDESKLKVAWIAHRLCNNWEIVFSASLEGKRFSCQQSQQHRTFSPIKA